MTIELIIINTISLVIRLFCCYFRWLSLSPRAVSMTPGTLVIVVIMIAIINITAAILTSLSLLVFIVINAAEPTSFKSTLQASAGSIRLTETIHSAH